MFADSAAARTLAVTALALAIGSAATLIPKVLLRTTCDASCTRGSDAFAAPVWATSVVFLAAVAGWAVERAAVTYHRRGAGSDTPARGIGDADKDVAARIPPTPPAYSVLFLPGTLNVGSVLLQLLALVFISAASLAGLRGLLILFTAALSWRLGLKDAPKSRFEWVCVAGSAMGAVLVGVASVLQAQYYPDDAASSTSASFYTPLDDTEFANSAVGSSPLLDGPRSTLLILYGGLGATLQTAPSPSTVAIGLGLSALGYAFAAAQVTLEQRVLEGSALTRWQIMGGEGAWGLVVCGLLAGGLALLPVDSAGQVEVPSRTLCCLGNTPSLLGLSVGYGASSLAFNATLLILAANVGANWRVFIFTARGLLTWGVESALYYGGGAATRPYGERVSPYTLLLLVGYALLISLGLTRSIYSSSSSSSGNASGKAAGKVDSGDVSTLPLLQNEDGLVVEDEEGG